jgi:hypothetical protein
VYVRHRVDPVLVLDQRADPERSRPLPLDPPLDPLRGLLIDHLGGMTRDVDEGRTEDDEVLDQRKKAG